MTMMESMMMTSLPTLAMQIVRPFRCKTIKLMTMRMIKTTTRKTLISLRIVQTTPAICQRSSKCRWKVIKKHQKTNLNKSRMKTTLMKMMNMKASVSESRPRRN